MSDGTPIAGWLRAWLWIEVLFGLAAISGVALQPEATAERFAWPIEPAVTAAVIGGLYLATFPTLVLQALARRWEMIRVLVPTAIAFTTAELVATLLHLEAFSTGSFPFTVWLASYVLPPGIFLAAYVVHQRRSGPPRPGAPLPAGLRRAMLVAGAIVTVEALVSLVVPAYLTSSFPWALTPLAARVLAGWFLAVGTLLLSMARENDRDRVRLGTPLLVLVLPLVAFQAARFGGQVDLSHPRVWTAVVVFGFTAIVGGVLARGGWRSSLR